MRMKTFQADSMQEALTKVKEEMGPDAVILKSRKTARRVMGKTLPCFEITAALDESLFAKPAPMRTPEPAKAAIAGNAPAPAYAKPAPARPQRAAEPTGAASAAARGVYDWKGSLRRVDEEGHSQEGGAAGEAAPPAGKSQSSLIELLRSELKDMKDLVDMPTREIKVLKEEIKAMLDKAMHSHAAGPKAKTGSATAARPPDRDAGLPPELHGLEDYLLDLDLEADLAADLARDLAAETRAPGRSGMGGSGEGAADLLARTMAGRIRTTGGIRLRPGQPTTVVLVGPTGVGKTTTLAKLASIAKLHQGKKVGIIAADCFRMGASEQLELFGKTAGIPVRTVFSVDDVTQAMRAFADRDLILVDTAGRSHTRKEMWDEFQALLRTLRPDEVHLVLSSTTRMRELHHQYALYRGLGAGSVIFTKLDECLSLGCMYNLTRRTGAPLSYLCNGQIIPDHIALARPEAVAAAVLSAGRPEPAAEAR